MYNRVKFFREREGLSLETVADMAGLTYAQMRHIEDSGYTPVPKTRVAIADAINQRWDKVFPDAQPLPAMHKAANRPAETYTMDQIRDMTGLKAGDRVRIQRRPLCGAPGVVSVGTIVEVSHMFFRVVWDDSNASECFHWQAALTHEDQLRRIE